MYEVAVASRSRDVGSVGGKTQLQRPLGVPGAIAVLNDLSTAQLAMEHPVSGGAYAYGRAEVGERASFVAGRLFLASKTASAAAIAVIVGQHLWPAHAPLVAALAVAALAALTMLGVRVTAWTSAAVVAVVLVVVGIALRWAATGRATTLTATGDGSLGVVGGVPWSAVGLGARALLRR